MKNKKWNVVSSDNRPVWVILFISRNKDNKHLDHFHERRQAFISKEPFNSHIVHDLFKLFVENGQKGELCRMYHSVNARNEKNIRKKLLHFLIDNPDFNVCDIQSKMAKIAAAKENAITKQWLFDFDIDDSEKLNEFCDDILKIDSTVQIKTHKTPNAYAVVVSHGFDTRKLFEKWNKDVSLKRDALLCKTWQISK